MGAKEGIRHQDCGSLFGNYQCYGSSSGWFFDDIDTKKEEAKNKDELKT